MAFCIAKEAKTAIYTNPQGKNPFRKPIVKKVSAVFFFNALPKADFTLEINLYSGLEKLYLLNIREGINITTIIKIPIIIESCCCIPKYKDSYR